MAQPDLSEDDLDALQALFDRMSECFLRGDSKALKAFLAETPERDEIVTALRREFKDAQYLDFQVDRPIPDNSFAKNRHSVDVTIRFKLVYKDDSRSPDLRKPVENTTFQSFVVQRESDGAFKIVNSSFFDNLGRRSGGMRMFVHILLFVMLLLLVLPFWVWMCAEAWFIRPRNWLWRCVAAVPAVGSLIFFFFRYLRKRKK